MDITMARMWLRPLDGGGHLTEVKFTMSFATFLIYLRLWLLIQKREAAFKWKFNCDFNATLTVLEE